MTKTLIISSDKKTSSLLFIDDENTRWKVIISDKGDTIQTWSHKGDDRKGLVLRTDFISMAEDFGSRFLLSPEVEWNAAEIRKLCPDWKEYNIILCLDGDISISGPDLPKDAIPAVPKENWIYTGLD